MNDFILYKKKSCFLALGLGKGVELTVLKAYSWLCAEWLPRWCSWMVPGIESRLAAYTLPFLSKIFNSTSNLNAKTYKHTLISQSPNLSIHNQKKKIQHFHNCAREYKIFCRINIHSHQQIPTLWVLSHW